MMFFSPLDEYATYIRLIDEILEQRYNYVIQSRRTIETFPVGISFNHLFPFNHFFDQYAIAKYPLLEIIAHPQRHLHCQVN